MFALLAVRNRQATAGLGSPVALRRRTHGSPVLEALPAENRPSLRRAERNRGFFAALRTGGFGLRPLDMIRLARARRALGFAVLAPLGLILEALVGEEHLFAGGENKLLAAFRALQNLIVVFHTLLRGSALVAEPAASSSEPDRAGFAEIELGSHFQPVRRCLGKPVGHVAGLGELILLPPLLLAQTFTRERLLCAAFLARLHVVAVLLYFLDDVFLLHFPLKTAQRIFQRLTFLNAYFSHLKITILPMRVAMITVCHKCYERALQL